MDNIDSKDYGKAISELHEAIRILHSNTEELFREEASNTLFEINKLMILRDYDYARAIARDTITDIEDGMLL